MHSVVQRKLNEWENGAPTLRRFSANAAEDILDNAVDAFRLTVGLRMVRGGHVQASAEHREDGTSRSIKDDRHGQAVLSEHAVEKQRSCTLTINGVRHSREVSPLAQSVYKDHNTRVACRVGR
ncbi:unnamed protein product [Phytophthora fragariaefolia]|uniref:Unnamed protein product n=1 Tax=Phytophthora fragariaefolia TaxID=1490495 RepID=A0A9W6XY57_9STRA|nr:unnamed protein product [Phytophthora fragariaefolia]